MTTLYTRINEHIGQVRLEEAPNEIERLNNQEPFVEWRIDDSNELFCLDETDDEILNPMPRSDGYVWITCTPKPIKNMKINQDLVLQLQEGKIAIDNTDDNYQNKELLRAIIQEAFPEDENIPSGRYEYYYAEEIGGSNGWNGRSKTSLPTIPLERFLESVEEQKSEFAWVTRLRKSYRKGLSKQLIRKNNSMLDLSKRDYFAGLAMQSFIAIKPLDREFFNPTQIAKVSVQYADSLLKQLQNEEC